MAGQPQAVAEIGPDWLGNGMRIAVAQDLDAKLIVARWRDKGQLLVGTGSGMNDAEIEFFDEQVLARFEIRDVETDMVAAHGGQWRRGIGRSVNVHGQSYR